MTLDIYASIAETPSTSDATQHRLLIVGAGAAGLELAARLGRSYGRHGRLSITVLDQSRIHVWKPLLHEVASGSLDSETESIELIAHAQQCHYRYRIGAMVGLDRGKRQVYVAETRNDEGELIIPARVLGYDTLVIAIGSLSNDFGTPGVKEHATTLDTLQQATRFNRRMIDACLRANAQYEPLRPGQLHCVIVGAGATGVELAAELHRSMRDLAGYNLDNIDFDKIIRIELIESAPRILNALPESLSKDVQSVLQDLDITIRTGTRVVDVKPDGVVLKSGEFIAAELIVWAAGIKAPDVLTTLDGLEVDRINRLVVRPTLQTTADDNIFAIGDCACCILGTDTQPLPPRAQTAHQQADFMLAVMAARLDGKALPLFSYRDNGSLVSLSEYSALGHVFSGHRIEGFLAKLAYRSLHKMHMLAVQGFWRVGLNTIAGLISKRTEPRIKLH